MVGHDVFIQVQFWLVLDVKWRRISNHAHGSIVVFTEAGRPKVEVLAVL